MFQVKVFRYRSFGTSYRFLFRPLGMRAFPPDTLPAVDSLEQEELIAQLLDGLESKDEAAWTLIREMMAVLHPLKLRMPVTNRSLIASIEGGLALGTLRLCYEPARQGTLEREEREEIRMAEPPPPKKPKLGWFEVVVVDEVGDPLAGLELVVSATGQKHRVTTDGAGLARVEGISGGSFGHVEFASLSAVRELVTPRWQSPRNPVAMKAPSLTELELDDRLEPVPLEQEQRHKVVLKPHRKCDEVVGNSFDFRKSFPRPREVVPKLREVVKRLNADSTRKALVYGHSDSAGSEMVNKHLSERRAKAIVALLTHDHKAWYELVSASKDKDPWWEWWLDLEAQVLLNYLEVRTSSGSALPENGKKTQVYQATLKRFQMGEWDGKPDGFQPTVINKAAKEGGALNEATWKQLFLCYAKRISKDPIPADRFQLVDGKPYMGCGEYNPLSLEAQDHESRRVVVLVLDPAAVPASLPCKQRNTGPCEALCAKVAPPLEPGRPEGQKFYRCPVYKALADKCPCSGGPPKGSWIELHFRDEQDRPVRGITLRLDGNNGKVKHPTADAIGMALASGVEFGTKWKPQLAMSQQKRWDTTFVIESIEEVDMPPELPELPADGTTAVWEHEHVAFVERVQVKDNDTLESIAEYHKVSVSDLCWFNFGGDTPAAIAEGLKWRVGCVEPDPKDKTKLIMSSQASPGWLYVPGEPPAGFLEELEPGKRYVVRGKAAKPHLFCVANVDDVPMPNVAVEVEWPAGGISSFTARSGILAIEGVVGQLRFSYAKPDELVPKAIAGSLLHSITIGDCAHAHRVLHHAVHEHSQASVEAFRVYDSEFSYDGTDLMSGLDALSKGSVERLALALDLASIGKRFPGEDE